MPWHPNKFRMDSTRLKHWDYSLNGCYYVTICTKAGKHFFGQVADGQVHLSTMGRVADQFWHEIPHHFADVILDRFVIMPNHLHGILSICKNDRANLSSAEMPNAVSTFGPLKPGSLSVVIGSYKSAVTKWCHQNGYSEFGWQPRFHDHGVEDEDSLNEIRDYIGNNPKRWEMKRKL